MMAMKFWFGKKETEPDERGTVSCDVLAIPAAVANSGRPASVAAPLVAEPQRTESVSAEKIVRPQPVFTLGVPPAANAPAAHSGDTGSAKPLSAEYPAPAPKTEVQGIKAVEVPAPAVVKAVGGGAVRLAARPAGTYPQAGPVTLAQVPGRPAFGLRPKAEEEPVSQAKPAESSLSGLCAAAIPEPVEKQKAAAKEDYDSVRPKTDQRALYYELMNGLYDALLILDDQGHVVDCNNRVKDLLGYTREDAWDLPVNKVITGMSIQMFEHLRRNLAENHHILIDARCFRQDGSSFAGEVGVSKLSLTRGSNIVFVIRNVERRKNAMDDLRRGYAAMEVALAPAFECDTDGFFQVVNQAFLDSFGIPDVTQAKQLRFVELLPDATRLFLRAACGEKLREKLSVATPGGHPLKLELALAPVQNGQSITGVAGSILQL